MIPNIEIHDLYYKFINDSKDDVIASEETRKKAEIQKIELYNELKEHIEDIIKYNDIDVRKYELEWNQQYNSSESLYNRAVYIYKKHSENTNIEYLLKIIKYCNALRAEYNSIRAVELANKRVNITFKQYRDILNDYFIKVHKCLLEGNGYEFGYGLGVIVINRHKNSHKNYRKHLDFAATRKRKKELLDAGIKLYDDNEAAWYKARNIPYDGVDYRVYLDKEYFYKIQFFYHYATKGRPIEFERVQYIHSKLRTNDYKILADEMVNKIDDIYSLPMDLTRKLSILLYKYPTKYLNFIRNAEQSNRTVRAYNREN